MHPRRCVFDLSPFFPLSVIKRTFADGVPEAEIEDEQTTPAAVEE